MFQTAVNVLKFCIRRKHYITCTEIFFLDSFKINNLKEFKICQTIVINGDEHAFVTIGYGLGPRTVQTFECTNMSIGIGRSVFYVY